ncbi:hypothetical protein H6P81_003030 [Aristolochia fimbriata]|uniref:Uncharacterized protein n=1 Tax=Aristolochia fimbriata TaxID=158543 RepID=A0AAV7FFL2_ARIFI|nr:hypothetical protein H6P81_003030 [Aristolochia fimbriata]
MEDRFMCGRQGPGCMGPDLAFITKSGDDDIKCRSDAWRTEIPHPVAVVDSAASSSRDACSGRPLQYRQVSTWVPRVPESREGGKGKQEDVHVTQAKSPPRRPDRIGKERSGSRGIVKENIGRETRVGPCPPASEKVVRFGPNS